MLTIEVNLHGKQSLFITKNYKVVLTLSESHPNLHPAPPKKTQICIKMFIEYNIYTSSLQEIHNLFTEKPEF